MDIKNNTMSTICLNEVGISMIGNQIFRNITLDNEKKENEVKTLINLGVLSEIKETKKEKKEAKVEEPKKKRRGRPPKKAKEVKVEEPKEKEVSKKNVTLDVIDDSDEATNLTKIEKPKVIIAEAGDLEDNGFDESIKALKKLEAKAKKDKKKYEEAVRLTEKNRSKAIVATGNGNVSVTMRNSVIPGDQRNIINSDV